MIPEREKWIVSSPGCWGCSPVPSLWYLSSSGHLEPGGAAQSVCEGRWQQLKLERRSRERQRKLLVMPESILVDAGVSFILQHRNWEKLETNPIMRKVDLWEIMNFLPKNMNNLSYWYWSFKALEIAILFLIFPLFTLHSNSLCSSLVTQHHIDFVIICIFFSVFLQSSVCPCLVSLHSLWVQIIQHNFSHLRVRYSPRLLCWAPFTEGRGRPSWQCIPRSLGRGKRLSLAFTGHLNLRERKRVTSPVIWDFPITAYYWAYKDKRRNKTKTWHNLKGKKVENQNSPLVRKDFFFLRNIMFRKIQNFSHLFQI